MLGLILVQSVCKGYQQTAKAAREKGLSAYTLCKQFGPHLQQLLSAHISALINTLEIYIANNINPDKTAPVGAVRSGFIVFSSMISAFEHMELLYVPHECDFAANNIGVAPITQVTHMRNKIVTFKGAH